MALVGGKYRLDVNKRIGGRVYQGTAINSGEPVAIKLERAREDQTLENEAHVYYNLSGGVGIPFVHSASNIGGGDKALVMDLLGPDLESLFNECNRKFSLKTVLLLADQLISRIEYIHSQSFIHRDITPEHLTMGRTAGANQVHVISFGLAEYYRDPRSHLHESYRENETCACTIPYMSIHAHRDVRLSRRDDMESLGYVLLYLSRGSLPWEELDIDEQLDEIEEMKISIEKSCPDALVELFVYFKHVRSLNFDETPNYSYLRKTFRDLFERQSFQNDYLFDWVVDRQPAAIDVQRRFNDDKTTEEQLQQLGDSFTQRLSIQEAVPREPSLVERLGHINSILLSQERISAEHWKLRNEDPSTREEWRYVIRDVISLLYTYCKFLLCLNHPTASDEMREMASTVPSRMWGHIHKLLDLMWEERPSSISHLLDFARTAHGCLTVALDYAPQFRAIWVESLAELSRYSMAVSTKLGDTASRRLHARIAEYWFWKAADLNPESGRIQHHFGVLSRPDVLKQLFYYLKSLISVQPHTGTRETIQFLFTGLPQMATHYPADHQALIVFVEAHALLFRRQDDSLFVQHANKFLSQLDGLPNITGNAFREQGVYIVASNYAAIFGYGHDDSELPTIFGTAKHKVELPAQDIKSSSKEVSLASQVAFATLSIILDLQDRRAALPSVHFSLAFLWCLAKVPGAMNQIQAYVPWKRLAEYLNMLISPDTDMSEIENAEFPRNDFGPLRQFAEDFFIRGFSWSQLYYPPGFFCDLGEDRETHIEFPSVTLSRKKRCLFVGLKLAECERWLRYDSKERRFCTTQIANTLQDISQLFQDAQYPTAIKECPVVLTSFIKAHGVLFNRGDDSTFDNSADQFLALHYATMFNYGSPPDARASHFAIAALEVILRRSNDAATLKVMMPSVYLSLVFLWCMARVPENMTHISPRVSWKSIANTLNKLIQLDKSEYMKQPGSPQHLEEDDFIRGSYWSSIYYSQNYFDGGVKCLSRLKRCLWLGKELAGSDCNLFYRSESPLFYTAELNWFDY